MDVKRKKKLHTVFIIYLIRFCVQTVLLILLMFTVFSIMMNKGFILPSIYAQEQLDKSAEQIEESDRIEEDMLPLGCRYGVYSENGNYRYGSFSLKEQNNIWSIKEGNKSIRFGRTYYRSYDKVNGEVCIVEYRLLAQFSNPNLVEYLPNAEHLFYAVFVILFFIQTLWIAGQFGRFMTKRLTQLNKVTGQIQEENLDFNQQHSDIKEIEEVLESLYKMKEALKTSLNEQWNREEEKREQVAALAHDIKTPLTVIRGNAELIGEIAETETVSEYNQYIVQSARDIEDYLILLQKALRSEVDEPAEKELINTERLLQKIIRQGEMLGKCKCLKIVSKLPKEGTTIYANQEELTRAIGNVLANAVEYSDIEGEIWVEARIDNEQYFDIIISDCGPGFSEEEQRKGKEQFYQSDKSRHSKDHYGLGLYIADTLVRKQGGILLLNNSRQTGGAEITLRFVI